jgi:hypothetical protein
MNRLIVLAGLVGAAPLAAQGVAVAPLAVHIDHRTRSGSVELFNPSNNPVEVEVSTLFGYPATDSAGKVRVRYVDDADSNPASAAGWIRAFPRRVTIPPQTRQTLRLLASPPAGLPEGEYWTRLAVVAEMGNVPTTGVTDSAVSIALRLRVRTIIAVSYRNGGVHTGIRMANMRTDIDGDSLGVRVDLTREGNAAFLGTLRTALFDDEGTEVRREDVQVAVYYDLSPRRTLWLEGLAPGNYTVVTTVDSERSDIEPRLVLPVDTVSDTVRVVVP